MQHPGAIANKIFVHMLKDEKEFVRYIQSEQGDRLFTTIL